MISEHSAHLNPLSVDFRTWLWRYRYSLLLYSMLWHRQAIFESKGDKLCSSAECRIWTRSPRHQIASRLNARWQTDWAIEDQAQPVAMISEHSAHLTPLSVHMHTNTKKLIFSHAYIYVNTDTYLQTFKHIHLSSQKCNHACIWNQNDVTKVWVDTYEKDRSCCFKQEKAQMNGIMVHIYHRRYMYFQTNENKDSDKESLYVVVVEQRTMLC